MAWSTGGAVAVKDDKNKKGGTALVSVVAAPGAIASSDTDEQRQQFAAALQAAAQLIPVVGRKGDPVTVSISGNANVGFAPGGATQFVTVTVTNTG